MAATPTADPEAKGRASKLHIVDDWKGMPALLDGERLVTRSANIENLERVRDQAEESGRRLYSTKVAAPDQDLDADAD